MSGPRFGSTIVFPPPGRWDPGTHLALTEQHRVTSWSGVPTHYWRMLEHPDFDSTDLSSLLSVGSGGTPFPPELIRLIRERIHDVDVSNGYGATETTGVGTVLSGPLSRARARSRSAPRCRRCSSRCATTTAGCSVRARSARCASGARA